VNFGLQRSNIYVNVTVLYHNHTELNIPENEAEFLQSNFILSVTFITFLHLDIKRTKEFHLI
jgi:hypothetical protein